MLNYSHLLAAICCCLSAAAAAAPILAYTEDVPPLNYQENGQVKGFSTELLRLLAREAGLEVKIEVLPWLRAYAKVKDTPGTLLYTLVRTPERESQFQWVGPISPRRIYLYRLRERRDIRVSSLADLARYRNGALAGSAAAGQLAGLGLGEQLDLGRSDDADLKKLQLGRVDLVAMLDWSMQWQLRQQGLPASTLEPAWLLDGKQQYWFALNPRSPPDWAKKLQAALERVGADGRLQAIRRHYRDD
ncbi:substrate-binding periplasmic protein [Chromobacterium sp. CV08]|uniref:substrate-binding periplasmic protein n=1 Tax=Chromobacterium sp. CV08 TaxID=3133274 RepID=UPI003DA842A4